MVSKKTSNKKSKVNTKQRKVSGSRAENIEPSNKNTPKYHFSINLTSNKSGKESSGTRKDSPKSNASAQAKTSEAKKQTAKMSFTKEAEAVRVAETVKPSEVTRIKHSDQRSNKVALGSVLGGTSVSDKHKSTELDKKQGSDVEAVKLSFPEKIKERCKKIISLKYWTYTLMGIMKAIDLFISFIIMPRGEGRNKALQKARSPILFGLWVFFIFFIIGGFWAGFAPLDKAVGANGFIVTSSKKQIIQHKDGGIVEKIYVREGDHVKNNQPLVKLEETQYKTALESAYDQRKETEELLKSVEERIAGLQDLIKKDVIAKFDQKVITAESQKTQLKTQLSETNAKIANYEEQLQKLVIKSPINGIVTQVNVTTIGGTVNSGQAIMTITPSQEDLLLEAYVQAQDIEPVYVGLKAKVQIAAFRSKTTSPLDGIVTYVSPDVVDLVQQPGGVSNTESFILQQGRGMYYKVRISIDKKQLKKISKFKDYELTPGMNAQVQITIGERTLVQYLLDPILMTFWHAFKEK